MFRILDVFPQRGIIRVSLETSDPRTIGFLRLLAEAEKFAHLFTYQLSAHVDAERRQQHRACSIEHTRTRRARMLAIFRQLPGPRRQRVKALREIMATEGTAMTSGAIAAALSIAIEEDRGARAARISELARAGHSIRGIARILKIPLSTVRRHARGCPRTGDLAAPRPPTPSGIQIAAPSS